MTSNLEPEFVNTKEASHILGIPVSTLVTWRSRSSYGPPFYKPEGTRCVLYNRKEIILWAKAQGQRRNTCDEVIIRSSSTSRFSNNTQGSAGTLKGDAT